MKLQTLFALLLPGLLIACSGNSKRAAKDAAESSVIVVANPNAKILPVEMPIRPKNQAVNLAHPLFSKTWEVPLGPNRIATSSQQEDLVFFTTDTNRLYCVNATSGTIQWVRPFALEVTFPVAINEDRLYYVAGDMLHQVEKTSGVLINKFQLDNVPKGGNFYRKDKYFVMAERGLVACHGIDEDVIGKGWISRLPEWHHREISFPTSPLIPADEYFYFTNRNKELVRISALTGGKDRRSFKVTAGEIFHTPIIKDKNIFFYATNNTFYAMNRFSFLPDWTYASPMPSRIAPVVGKSAYALPVVGGMHVLDAKGKLAFKTTEMTVPLMISNDHIIGRNRKGHLLSLNMEGKVTWSQKMPSSYRVMPMSNNTFLFTNSNANTVGLYTLNK